MTVQLCTHLGILYVLLFQLLDHWSWLKLSSTSQASRRSMPGTDYVSAINVHTCRSVIPDRAGGYAPSMSAAYSHMPPTYSELSSTSQANRRYVGDRRRWKCFMWTSSAVAMYSSERIRSLFRGKMVENCATRFAFRANLCTYKRSSTDAPGTHRDISPNVVSCNRRLRRR